MNRLFVVDFENIQDLSFLKEYHLDSDDKVTIFYSEKQSKIELKYIEDIWYSGCELELVKAQVGCANALDFQLVTYVVHLVSNLNSQHKLSIYVASRDKGFHLAFDYLQTLISFPITFYYRTTEQVIEDETLIRYLNECGLNVETLSQYTKSEVHNILRSKLGNDIGLAVYNRYKEAL